jgi:hypothetical protein
MAKRRRRPGRPRTGHDPVAIELPPQKLTSGNLANRIDPAPPWPQARRHQEQKIATLVGQKVATGITGRAKS